MLTLCPSMICFESTVWLLKGVSGCHSCILLVLLIIELVGFLFCKYGFSLIYLRVYDWMIRGVTYIFC